jgi:hypothetical protein
VLEFLPAGPGRPVDDALGPMSLANRLGQLDQTTGREPVDGLRPFLNR